MTVQRCTSSTNSQHRLEVCHKHPPALMARSKVKWDEANLEENETIKAAINPTKIDEPKTPYHRPMSDEDDDPLGLAPSIFTPPHVVRLIGLPRW